jgi:hypothetical protein
MLDVKVGKVVELTEEDRRRIRELTDELSLLTRHQRSGWFALYVRSLTRINRLVQVAVERSHAS